MRKALIGAGGFAREIMAHMGYQMPCFIDEEYWYHDMTEQGILPLNMFDPKEYEVLIAIGDPNDRAEMVKKLPKETEYFSYVHPSAQLLGDDITIGKGTIICPGTIITTNVMVGDHVHLNLLTTIGHDCMIGNYFTTAPGAKISGNCIIRDRVYVGTNASIREKLEITEDVTIGLNAGVVKNILESGVYGGVPAKKIK